MLGAARARKELDIRSFENPAWQYAAIRNLLYRRGKAIELLGCYEPSFRYFAGWWQQLFGESEGKDGKGLFPATVGSVLEKLRQIENRYSELESKLADPAYYSDPAVFTGLCREQRELQPVVEAYRAYAACEAQIAQAQALLGDPELHEIAREELESGSIT